MDRFWSAIGCAWMMFLSVLGVLVACYVFVKVVQWAAHTHLFG